MAKGINVNLNIGYNCNARCSFCNRLIDLFQIPNANITLDQVKVAFQRYEDAGIKIAKVKISGGEPSLHPELIPIVSFLLDNKIAPTVWVLSNGLKKELPKLPSGARWKVDPILDPKDGWKNHQPFLISPDDLGIRSETCGRTCSIMRTCGRGLEAFGFTFCGVAGALGHLLGVNVYSDQPVMYPDENICKHCIYSLPDEQQKELQKKCPTARWPNGTKTHSIELQYPTKTFKDALEKYRKEPNRFPRLMDKQ